MHMQKKTIFGISLILFMVFGFTPKSSFAAIGDDTGVSFSTYAGVNIAQGNGVAFDGTYFYVVDSLTEKVYKFDSNVNYTGTSFDLTAGLSDYRGIAYYDGYLWIVDSSADEVYKYQTDGTYTTVHFDTAASGNTNPRGITAYNDFFWITDVISDEVYKYQPDGTYTTVHFDTAASLNTNPSGIVAYNDFFWISDFGTDEVYKYNPDGSYANISFDTAASGVNSPNNITTYDNFLWLVDSGFDGLAKFEADGTFVSIDYFTGNLFPQGISSGGGFFWIADYATDEVYKYDLDGTYTGTHFDTAANGATNIRDILYYDGYLWLPESSDDEVYKYQTNGTYVTSFDTGADGGNGPLGMTYYNGYFWILDSTDPSILKYNLDGTYAGTEFDLSFMWGDFPDFNPEGILFYNDLFWIADYTDKQVFAFNLDGTYANFSFDTAISGNIATNGITSYNNYFWVTGDGDSSVYKFEGDIVGPVISEITPVPTSTIDTTPDYVFTTDEAGDITYGGSCTSATNTAVIGNNTITFNELNVGSYTNCTITVTDAVGNDSNLLSVNDFTVNRPTSSGSRPKTSIQINISVNDLPIPILTPIPPEISKECLLGHKFSNITGSPCPTLVEVNTENESQNKFIFTKSLWTQMIDPDVKELQKYLNTHGFPVALSGAGSLGNETTKFGNLTRDALIKFQLANKISPAVGFFGPITRGIVNQNN